MYFNIRKVKHVVLLCNGACSQQNNKKETGSTSDQHSVQTQPHTSAVSEARTQTGVQIRTPVVRTYPISCATEPLQLSCPDPAVVLMMLEVFLGDCTVTRVRRMIFHKAFCSIGTEPKAARASDSSSAKS
jgi:hypothetical protein